MKVTLRIRNYDESDELFDRIVASDNGVHEARMPLYQLFNYHINLISPHDYRNIGNLFKI